MLRWRACAFLLVVFSGCGASQAASAGDAVKVLTVCDVESALATYDKKVVMLVGRLSKRDTGRWVGEDACPGGAKQPVAFTIRFDREDGPKPPDDFAIDSSAAALKFKAVGQTTALRDFPFGSGAYDRWGMVFGRIESASAPGGEPAIVCRGEALIFLWGEAAQ